jgi:hypothetical protein
MSSEPPGSGNAHGEGPATEAPGEVNQQSSGAGRVRWRSIVTLLGVLAIATGVGLYLFRTQAPNEQTDQPAATRGGACPRLLLAADANERGDRVAFSREIGEAAKVAEDTLQTSGEEFGEPERIALELELGQIRNPEHLLDRARDVCSELAPPTSS